MSKTYDHEILTELDDHFSNILDLLNESDMEDDSANGFRDQIYQYINPQQVRLNLIMKKLAPEPVENDSLADELRDDFREILCRFNKVLLDKLLANERKYKFGYSWQESDWEEQLQRDLVAHVEKGDPRDVAIFGLFAWHHGWRTAPEQEADWQLEARTERNLNLIDSFTNHLKEMHGIEIPDEAVVDFFEP